MKEIYPSGWKVSLKISDLQISQLICYATTDDAIKRYTSDSSRFSDMDSFNKWLSKGRKIYALSDKIGNLAGIIWFGEKNIPEANLIDDTQKDDYDTTFAIRMYGWARGKGLAKSFMEDCFKDFTEKYGNKGIWLEVSCDNKPAIALYEKFGFSRITNPDSENKILMILDETKL